jgi:hypothetical protein
MALRFFHRRLVGGVLGMSLLGLLLGHGVRESLAADEEKKDLTKAKFYGVGTCKDCHREKRDRNTDLVKLTEYETWRTQDRHAVAYAVLEGPRGRRMGELLGTNDKPFPVTTHPACLNCHTMNYAEGRKAQGFSLKDGVSCDTCHGPAEFWLNRHAYETDKWRIMSPEEKEALGMYNVRDPVKRARLCLSCHVGSPAEGKVVTHAMYAAGHPSLAGFELASYSQNLPPHWYELKDVPYLMKVADEAIRKNYFYDKRESVQTRLVLAGGLAEPQVVLHLLANRARLDGKPAEGDEIDAFNGWSPAWLRPYWKDDRESRFPELLCGPQAGRPANLKDRWPELAMAHADCFACHHDLKSANPRPLGGRPARVGPPSWPFALLDTALLGYGLPGEEVKKKTGPLGTYLTSLDSAYEHDLFGEPNQLAPASRAFVKWADRVLREKSPSAINTETAANLLRELCKLPNDQSPDFDSARQIAWAFRAIHREWPSAIRKPARADEIVEGWKVALNLDPDSVRDKRQELVKKALGNERLADLMEDKDKKKDPRFLEENFFAPLQQLHDQEWSEAAKKRDDYDPAAFKASLKELAQLLK